MTSFLFSSSISSSIILNTAEDHAGGTKRILSFEDDSERSQLKKRRKQSKPVRITAQDGIKNENNDVTQSEEGDFSSDSAGSEPTLQLEDRDHLKSDEVDPISKETSAETNVRATHLTLEGGESIAHPTTLNPKNLELSEKTIPLNLSKPFCGDTEVNVDVLSFLDKSDGSDFAKNDVPSSHSMPAYHQCQGPYQKSNSTSDVLSSLPSLVSSFKQFRSPNLKSPIGLAPLRIFNPEAFCNLCNKEFCNKYFLKTHKANKHGIYSDNIGSNSLDSYNNEYPQNSIDTSNNSAMKFWFSRKPFPLNSLVSLSRISPNAQSTNGNLKAYCNICQREFCNKYFVRRHKAKIHGLVESADGVHPDEYLDVKLLLDDQQNSFQVLSPKSESEDLKQKHEMELANYPEALNSPPIISESAGTSSASDLISRSKTTKLSSSLKSFDCNSNSSVVGSTNVSNSKPICEVCEKEFCSRHSLRRHKAKVHGIRTSVIGTSLGQDILMDRLNEDSSPCSYSESESICMKSETQDDSQQDKRDLDSPSKTSLDNDRLNDNCKSPSEQEDLDFSLNRPIKTEKVSNASSESQFPSSTSGPLNLVLSNNENFLCKTDKTQQDNERNENCLCDLCGKSFQSQFLLNMHKTYFHNFSENVTSSKRDSNRSPSNYNEGFDKKSGKLIIEENFKKERPDEDVQKLHSLILKLNNLNVENVTVCEVCNEDLGHISSLENHILWEHGKLLDEVSRMIEEEGQSSPNIPLSNESKLVCRLCQKQFSSPISMDQHICIANSVSNIKIPHPSVPITSEKEVDENYEPSQPKIQLNSENPSQMMSTSFCDICKKELCNKYFMKTHMQRMHNISIETGANVGGVVCDICNKTLCSKYFLRVHKQNSHGIIDDVSLPPRLWMNDIRNQSPNSTDASLKPTDKTDFGNKYFSYFTEVCPLCNRGFRSPKWLRAHLLNDHGEEGKVRLRHFQNQLSASQISATGQESQEFMNDNRLNLQDDENSDVFQANFIDAKNISDNNILTDILNGKNSKVKQCNYCPFSTKILALLFMHERTHLTMTGSLMNDTESGIPCPLCREKFTSTGELEKHVTSHYNLSSSHILENFNKGKELFDEKQVSSETGKGKPNGGNLTTVLNPLLKIQGLDLNIIDQLRKNPAIDLNTTENLKTNSGLDLSLSDVKKESNTDSNLIDQLRKNPALDLNIINQIVKNPSMNLNLVRKSLTESEKVSGNKDSSGATVHKPAEEKVELKSSPSGSNYCVPNFMEKIKPECDVNDVVSKMKDAINALAVKTNLPTTFAIPQNQESYVMQPFFLENFAVDQMTEYPTNQTFLSSVVYLPVKQKLSKTVTASFRLTPT